VLVQAVAADHLHFNARLDNVEDMLNGGRGQIDVPPSAFDAISPLRTLSSDEFRAAESLGDSTPITKELRTDLLGVRAGQQSNLNRLCHHAKIGHIQIAIKKTIMAIDEFLDHGHQ
jgi:hypothetical protein